MSNFFAVFFLASATRGTSVRRRLCTFISDQARDDAADAASCIETNHPSFVKRMLPSHVSSCFWLVCRVQKLRMWQKMKSVNLMFQHASEWYPFLSNGSMKSVNGHACIPHSSVVQWNLKTQGYTCVRAISSILEQVLYEALVYPKTYIAWQWPSRVTWNQYTKNHSCMALHEGACCTHAHQACLWLLVGVCRCCAFFAHLSHWSWNEFHMLKDKVYHVYWYVTHSKTMAGHMACMLCIWESSTMSSVNITARHGHTHNTMHTHLVCSTLPFPYINYTTP